MAKEKVQLRIYGNDSLPTLIYLPGLHGDWTLIGSFRQQVIGKTRFVEMTYPRTLTWSLDEYAAAVEAALLENGIDHGWLLGESFGSQVLWAMVGRNQFRLDGLILAGGFVKHPINLAIRMAEKLFGRISLRMVAAIIFGYAKIARFRYRRSPETMSALGEFIERRTQQDLQAAQHRLHLVAENDPREIAKRVEIKVFALTGILDPIVPWPLVRRWLRKNCASLRDYQIITRADHNVLATAPRHAAAQILKWVG